MSLTLLERRSGNPAGTGTPARPSRPRWLTVVPATDPPYDDEVEPVPAARHGAVDGALAMALPLTVRPRPDLRLVPDPAPRTHAGTGRDITPDALPAPQPRALQLVRALLEVLAGDRPAAHLARVTATEVQEAIEASAGRTTSRAWAGSLRSLRVSTPSPGVAEVTAVVDRGRRCGGLGLRMEGLDGRWIITELALP